MRLAIADLPISRPVNPNAFPSDAMLLWGEASSHDLIRERLASFDGWAVAVDEAHLPFWREHGEVAQWTRNVREHRFGTRSRKPEYVIFQTPENRSPLFGATMTLDTDDIVEPTTFHKPAAWTRWVLALLGHQPGADAVDDLYMTASLGHVVDGMLPIQEVRAA